MKRFDKHTDVPRGRWAGSRPAGNFRGAQSFYILYPVS